MTTVQTYLHAQLPEVYKWQVLSFMKVEWPFIFSGDDQFSQDTYPPELDPVHFVVTKDEALISHAEIIQMQLRHQGIEYRIYGLGNVFTFPPYRGQGYGQEAVKTGTTYILKSAVDVAILFCDPKLQTFYAKVGWQGLPEASTRLGKLEKGEEHDGLRMMLFLSEKGQAGYSSFANQPLYIDDPW